MKKHKPQVGAPCTYDEKKHLKLLVEGIKSTLSLAQAAELAGVPKSTFKDWISTGDQERAAGLSTSLAQLSATIRKTQAIKARELVKEAMEGKKNMRFIQWLLTVCFREDFGQDAQIYKDLLDNFVKMANDMKRLNDSPLQGFVGYGETNSEETKETPQV